MKVKSILISQPKPTTEKSPYFDLAKKHNIKIDFRSFIHVEGIDAKDFRKERVNILEHTAVIFTSRNAVDHFFRICDEMRITVPDTMKYFCMSEAIAFYLQNYIVYRKRKIFVGKLRFEDLMDHIKKHKDERFLLPSSDIQKAEIPELLDTFKINYTKAVLYKTVCSDISDLKDIKYDMLVFFSPSEIESLYMNFPNFEQNETRIAAFGPTTAKAVKDAGLRLDINAPMPNAPSMSMAIEQYIKKANH
ncbi:MAG TPA: uroporphyrinogen-III synthase [Luteibaculaceae bacterium]|nr:uroporphyrinogen-III synthase [Luteibaculaceae bacterium]